MKNEPLPEEARKQLGKLQKSLIKYQAIISGSEENRELFFFGKLDFTSAEPNNYNAQFLVLDYVEYGQKISKSMLDITSSIS
jgi:hypothetical protein